MPQPCDCQCTCDDIARVRADEREQAAQRVEVLSDLLMELVREHAETVDGEWGCCHRQDTVNGTEWSDAASDYCYYLKVVNEWTARLDAARGGEPA